MEYWLTALLPALVLGLHLWEQHGVLAWPLVNRSLLPPQVYTVIGQVGGGLIELPIGMARPSIAWQPVHQQPTFGGMAENAAIFWPPGFRKRLSNGFIAFLRRVTRDPDRNYSYTPAQLDSLRAEGFRWVVLDRQLVDSEAKRAQEMLGKERVNAEDLVFRTTASMTARLGDPTAAEGALLVWDLEKQATPPAALAVDPEGLRTRSWPTEDMPAYEQHLRELGRIEGP